MTYNALPWLERCLDSVSRYETIVVDNGSTDGTVELVRERFPEVRLVEQPNLGLAAGWNRGAESASGRFVLLLNADAWIVGDAVEALVATPRSHAAGRDRRPEALATPTASFSAPCAGSRPLAAGNGVRLPPQARASLARAERRSTPATSTTGRCARSTG